MTEETFTKVEEIIKVKFKNRELLEKALTHRSYLNESNEDVIESNERLEFLGDAILQFVSSEYIFINYKGYPEGELTNLRSKLVNTTSLADKSSRLNLGQYLLISKGERETAMESSHILANTFESLIGAIYLDLGLTNCKRFIYEELLYKTKSIVENGELKDSKSLFQELSQERFSVTPIYKVVQDDGPDHDKTFIVGAYIENKLIAKGEGSSKRKAQQDAAQNSLKALNNIDS